MNIPDRIRRISTIIVRYSCGHSTSMPRPAGTADPLYCLCVSCHPAPVAVYAEPCHSCEKGNAAA